ncbi:MAG: hypothetical protein AB8C84_01635 [Oligoflexales bacterium]
MRYSYIFSAFFLLCTSCGSETNINSTLFSLDGSNESIKNRFIQARSEYNTGNYNAAESTARKILATDPKHSDASLLLANILLGKAGVDPFDVTIKLINLESDTALADDDSVSNLFTDLASILNITDEDFESLGTIDTNDFSDLPVLVPNKLDATETDPRQTVSVLRYVNEAISLLCPFVSPKLRENSADDSRHACTASEETSDVVAKHDLTWAIAHLAEAILFNAVLTYSPTEDDITELHLNPFAKTGDAAAETSSNLLLRVNRMQASSPASISELATFTTQMNTIQTLFSLVFDTSETGMLNATMDDITAITEAFAGIAGMPESVTKQLTSTFDQLTTAAQKTSGEASETITANQKVEAFREQMQSSMASVLTSSVDSALTTISPNVSAAELETFNENKTAVCDNLNSILNYEDATAAESLPDSCS